MVIKSTLLVLCFGALALGQSTPSVPQCGANQIYFTCGSACPPTCDSPNPQWCAKPCNKGCFCKPGYLKNSAGKCVLPKDCSTPKASSNVCTIANEVYSKCGSPCTKTCRNPEPGTCKNICIKGCFCKEGYLRNDDTGACVTSDQCPKMGLPEACRSDEVWNSCGSDCEAYCKDRSPTCDEKCKSGCFCKDGTIRQTSAANATCVAPAKCPA